MLTGGPSTSNQWNWHGYDVDVDGDWVIGGSGVAHATEKGPIVFWKWNSGTTTWDHHSTIYDPDAPDSYFGIAVDLDGERAIVGARKTDKAYIYDYNSGTDTWDLTQTLTGTAGELFGSGVNLSGDYAVVGAFDADPPGGINAGAAYVYEQVSPGNWSQVTTLLPDTITSQQNMGTSVTVSGDTFLVGGSNRGSRTLSGDAFVFEYMGDLTMPGDADGDGDVDGADAAILAGNWQKTDMDWVDGDFNGDDVVNDSDATILAANWTGPLGAAVPEPGTITLLCLGGLTCFLLRLARGRRR